MIDCVIIDGRPVGPGKPPYIVAELSGNHNGELARAIKILEAAKVAGADAVKLQTYTSDTMTIDHSSKDFVINGGLWNGRTLYELYQEAHTPWEWHEPLFNKAKELGITIFSTPFDTTAVDFLESLGAPAYKIASFEVIDLPLIRRCAQTGKPLIISTGMASIGEIAEAVAAARNEGNEQIVLLHCTSAYPAKPADAHLRTMPHLAKTFGVVSGLSDHTIDLAVAVAGAALGASLIEKHFTMSRADGGPDASFSLEPLELEYLVSSCKIAYQALGRIEYDLLPSEAAMHKFRRSLFVVEDIAEGELLTQQNIRAIRPGNGLSPKYLPEVLERQAVRGLKRGTPLSWDMLAEKIKNS